MQEVGSLDRPQNEEKIEFLWQLELIHNQSLWGTRIWSPPTLIPDIPNNYNFEYSVQLQVLPWIVHTLYTPFTKGSVQISVA